MESLVSDIRSCEVCKQYLPLGPRPIVAAHPKSKIALISQAPGRIAHESGIPWEDPGGKELKRWLSVVDAEFYNPENFAIVPIGFCYPGKGKNGDLPPRPECAPLWHKSLLDQMPKLQLTLLIGQYAQQYYLKGLAKKNLTETVRSFRDYLPKYIPLPHPSPRNRFWQMKNPWFVEEVIPQVQDIIQQQIQ